MNQVNRKNRNDVLFIAVLLLIVVLAGVAFFFLRGEGDSVTVSVDGKHYGTYPLRTDLTLSIRTGEEGDQENLLVIRDGKALVESATCPDGICAAHKPISREGESIVCLPHRVVITVHTTDGEEPDIIA
jgi:hypothetical protein